MKKGEFDYRGIDELIHSRFRLCLLLLLERFDEVSFARIREALATTDGNLITHLRKLEQAGYVRASREPRLTSYRLTPSGRRNLRRYRRSMETLLGLGRE